MNEFFDDPHFPGRPNHPDLDRLMDVVFRHDGATQEGGRSPKDVIADYIDPDSLEYMAIERAKHVTRETGLPAGPLAALILDGFILGIGFERAGGHREP